MSDEDLRESFQAGEFELAAVFQHGASTSPAGHLDQSQITASGLHENARAVSKSWTLSGRKARSSILEDKLRKATKIIRGFDRASETVVSNSVNQRLKNQPSRNTLRSLRSAVLDVRAALRLRLPLPHARDGCSASADEFPRAYLAGRAFLKASGFAFDEAALIEYMEVVQESGFFEMAEIWLLKPAMQLFLLERIVDKSLCGAGNFNDDSTQGSRTLANQSGQMLVLIACLQKLNQIDLRNSFLVLSETESILRDDPEGVYTRMDFESCDLYRSAIQELASGSSAGEFAIANLAVELAKEAQGRFEPNTRLGRKRSHIGYYLLDRGRKALQKRIHYRPPWFQQKVEALQDAPELFYFLGIEILIFAVMAFVLSGLSVGAPLVVAILFLLLPASESAIEVINLFTAFLVRPRALPKLDFSDGIPADCTTIVAVPTLLLNEEQIKDLVRTLEIRFVGNRDPALYFALLTDPPDASERFDEKDKLVSFCSGLIEELNRKYGRAGTGPFFHFHRHRIFNESENSWMGWERKRGKLLDFNDLLRGSSDSFPVKIGDLSVLSRIRYVITLDSDTQLPRDSAHRLIGTLSHPLNCAEIDRTSNIVREGYGVLQPRVGISVHSASRSRLAYIYSGQTGLDTYTRAVSDVYQDLFGEGIFTGKGIYEVDVFRQVLGQRFPSNAILSHDLIEGAYARAGLVSDVEIIDDYPSHFSAHSRRRHRWIRGDWQILRWLFSRVPDANGKRVRNPLGFVARWKILDNLRRSVLESATFALFIACWFFLPGSAAYWTAASVALMLIPRYVQLFLALPSVWRSNNRLGRIQEILDDFISGQVSVLIFFAFLAHQTLVTMDAVFRTVVRLAITHRNLLEWETAAQSEMEIKRKTTVDVYLDLSALMAFALAIAVAVFRPHALLAASPVLFLWMIAKPAARWLDRPLRAARNAITAEDEHFLRMSALRTWRFFSEFSGPEDNWLIPDNVQGKNSIVAHRISPTNLGLLLNARYAAYDLGFHTIERFLKDTETSLASAKKLPKFKGHFLNWYSTNRLTVLEPSFVSSVDSGNLACSLWVLKHGSLAAIDQPLFRKVELRGLRDHVEAIIEEMEARNFSPALLSTMATIRSEMESVGNDFPAWFATSPAWEGKIREAMESIARETGGLSLEPLRWCKETASRLNDLRHLASMLSPWLLPEFSSVRMHLHELLGEETTAHLSIGQFTEFISRLRRRLEELPAVDSAVTESRNAKMALLGVLPDCLVQARAIRLRLQTLAEEADSLVQQMDFRMLYDRRRELLSVGYDVDKHRLEESCYDLLASEARSAAFVAIAKGDIPQTSWFRLGRTHTEYAGVSTLLSWTGTMFEYLMPHLWMKTYPETLLEKGLLGAVACQRKAVQLMRIPWGISESACGVKNDVNQYEYRAFGIKELALKSDMPDRTVIAPYAAFLALNVDPAAAVENLRTMKSKGWLGQFGFFESVDFGPQDPKRKCEMKIVRCWMAHHQGMILVSVCNILSNSVFQRLFHLEIMVAATERLLHERSLSPSDNRRGGIAN